MNIKLYVFTILLLVPFSNTSAQSVTLKTLLDATTCATEDCFLEQIKPHQMCFTRSWSDPNYTYYSHLNCGSDSTGTKRLTINFAKGNDGVFNSSFLTRNQAYANNLLHELATYGFKKIDSPSGGESKDTWYHSSQFPSLDIMWQEFLDNKQQKVWHVGLVWK